MRTRSSAAASADSSCAPEGNSFACSRYATMSAYVSVLRLPGLSLGIDFVIRSKKSLTVCLLHSATNSSP